MGTRSVHPGGASAWIRSSIPSGAAWSSSAASRRSFQSNKSRDTKPELELRRCVHAIGLRYRVNTRPLPQLRRSADLVFPTERVAVFLDGCFWHGCPEHGRIPRPHADYWTLKIEGNRRRDRETDAILRMEGWVPFRVWEHEDPRDAATLVHIVVQGIRERLSRR
jgi:DNA mismatch endonuclease (patch repair protein)